ncbi:MAG: hypothetical protein QOE79_107 [Sphingomonadales bacterium]|jgi:hypothetical protein|nr:hypothetical protein [Sphingomonadales bacterium]
MAKQSAAPAPIFRGSPRRLSSSHPALAGRVGEIVLPDELAAEASGPAISLRGSRAAARLSLPSTSPPGRYAAQLRVGDETVPVELDIAPTPRLKVFPTSAHFAAGADSEASVDINVANVGNVAIDLPPRFVVGMFDDDGLEMAFVEAYREETDDPARLFGSFLRGLRSGYGGLLKLRIGKGAGSLAPGEERSLTLSAHLPETLKPGHSYHGIWKLGPVHYRITVAA